MGTKSSINMSPAYGFGDGISQNRQVGKPKSHETFKTIDQFGGEMRYISDCILNDREREPDAVEGVANLHVIEGIVRALESGQRVVLPSFERTRQIDPETHRQTLRAVSAPKDVNASSPAKGEPPARRSSIARWTVGPW